jgi:hypothetical protein
MARHCKESQRDCLRHDTIMLAGRCICGNQLTDRCGDSGDPGLDHALADAMDPGVEAERAGDERPCRTSKR